MAGGDFCVEVEAEATVVMRRMRVAGEKWRWSWMVLRGNTVIGQGERGKWLPAMWAVQRAVDKHFPKDGTL